MPDDDGRELEVFGGDGAAARDSRLDLDREQVENGLAQLVLTLVELLRRLLERQTVSRMERGTLTDAELDRLGEALYRLEEKIEEICAVFGLRREELNIDLGPLGDLF